MKRVLWISRHFLSSAQLAGLERFCGDEISVTSWQENVEDLQDLHNAVADAQVIAAVLPVHLLAQLVQKAEGKPVLVSIAKRELIPTEGGEPLTRFTHGGWQRIAKLELEMEAV